MHEFGFFVFRRIRIICVISDKDVNYGTDHQFTGYDLDSVNVCSGIEFYSQFLKRKVIEKFFLFKNKIIIYIKILRPLWPLLCRTRQDLVKNLPEDKYNIYQSPNPWNSVLDSVNHWQDSHHLHLIQMQCDMAQF